MSQRNRQRREQNRLAKQGITGVDYAALAEAVHRSVCSYTGTDGSGDCLTYAIVGCAWLNRHTLIPHALGGGYFGTTLKEVGPVFFEHYWIMSGAIGKWTYLDFSTRHNPALIRRGIAKSQPSLILPPDAFDEAAIGIPFYVGDATGLQWEYELRTELSLNAHQQYTITDKAEAAVRCNRYLR